MLCINKNCKKEVRAKNKHFCQECYLLLKRCSICEKVLYDKTYDICFMCCKLNFRKKVAV